MLALSKNSLVVATVAALLLAGTAGAVSLNPRGQGQALVFPYYTTAAGNATLTNFGNDAKVVQLRIAEGENGRGAAALTIYLSQKDSWTGAVFDRGEGQAPALLSTDHTCTWPELTDSTTLPQLPDGRRYMPLGPLPADAGSTSLQRLREGFVEAVEVATIRRDSATGVAITPSSGVRNCAAVAARWTAPDGIWLRDPLQDLANPTGDLGGEVAVVNVANGSIFAVPALALDDYRADPLDNPRGTLASVARHSQASASMPSLLSHALSDPAAMTAKANLIADGRALQLTYPVPAQAVDAVSAVLMTAQMGAPFEESAESGARSSLVLTYPTRAFYTDTQQPGAQVPLAPFVRAFAGVLPLPEAGGLAYRVVDREAVYLESTFPQPGEGCGFTICPPTTLARLPGTSVEVLAPGGTPDPLLGTRLHGDIGFIGGSSLPQQNRAGWLQLTLAPGNPQLIGPLLRPSLEGYRLRGLPVIGTRLLTYVNAHAAPGMLANYSTAMAISSSAACIKTDATACQP